MFSDESSLASRRRPYKRLLGNPDDDDAVLLQDHSEIPSSFPSVSQRELKYKDYASGPVLLSDNADMSGGVFGTSAEVMLGVDQSSGPNQRDGIRIHAVSLHFQAMVYHQGATDADYALGNMAFIALVLDKQTNMTQCLSQQIFANFGGQSLLTCTPQRNMDWSSRFDVLRSESFNMESAIGPGTTTGSLQIAGCWRVCNFFVLLNKVVHFSQFTGSLISSLNSLSIHPVGFQSGGDVPQVYCAYNSRLRFFDMD